MGSFKAALNKNHIFGTFLWSKWAKKVWLFPNNYDKASCGVSKWPKMGSYSNFVIGGTKFDFQNPKLIVTNDYQHFLAHFDWFWSLFKISDVKSELSMVELKVCKNGIFGAKILLLSSSLYLSLNHSISLYLSLSLRDRDRADTIITFHHTTENFLRTLGCQH